MFDGPICVAELCDLPLLHENGELMLAILSEDAIAVEDDASCLVVGQGDFFVR